MQTALKTFCTLALAAAITVILNGQVFEFEGQQPIIENGRVLVPARAIFEAFDMEVNFFDADDLMEEGHLIQAVGGRFPNFALRLNIGSRQMQIGGGHTSMGPRRTPIFIFDPLRFIELDVPPQIVNGHTLVPARAIAEALGGVVEWDEESRTVYITSGPTYNEGNLYEFGGATWRVYGFSLSGMLLMGEISDDFEKSLTEAEKGRIILINYDFEEPLLWLHLMEAYGEAPWANTDAEPSIWPLHVLDEIWDGFVEIFDTVYTISYLEDENTPYSTLFFWTNETLRDVSFLFLPAEEVFFSLEKFLMGELVILNIALDYHSVPQVGVIFTDHHGTKRQANFSGAITWQTWEWKGSEINEGN